jgi:hypothetical protein
MKLQQDSRVIDEGRDNLSLGNRVEPKSFGRVLGFFWPGTWVAMGKVLENPERAALLARRGRIEERLAVKVI